MSLFYGAELTDTKEHLQYPRQGTIGNSKCYRQKKAVENNIKLKIKGSKQTMGLRESIV